MKKVILVLGLFLVFGGLNTNNESTNSTSLFLVKEQPRPDPKPLPPDENGDWWIEFPSKVIS